MDTSRDELLGLLHSLGVELPRKTKVPDADLEKRLSKALDCCQSLNRVVPSPPLDPTGHRKWKAKNKALEAVRRHNFGEATYIHESNLRGVEQPFPLYENAFMDLRQSLMTIGDNWDSGHHFLVFQDKAELSGIVMRVLEVREFDARTPIFVVIFAHDTRAAPNPKTVDWISSYVGNPGEKPPIANVTATPQEQQLLLRLLNQNSKRLSPSYNPKRAKTEGSFTLSFLLPVGPLGPKEMGSFNRNDGCSVCGVPAKSKCSRCGAIRYCSAVCQREDWKLHRPTCTSLVGGTWQRITFTIMNPSRGLVINRFTSVFENDLKAQIKQNDDDSALQSPPNTHGCMPFIVKVQLSTGMNVGPLWPIRKTGLSIDEDPHGSSMLIYDRQRTFEVHVIKASCGSNVDFEAVENVVKKGDRGLKVFLWAIRTGEWTIDLCLNQLPEWQKW